MPLLAHIRNVLFPRRAVTAAVTDPAFRDRRGDGRPQSKIKNRKSQTANRSAFTLVELLVVIAIIGILISLVMPSLRGAQDAARSVGCRSNLRQLGMLAFMQASDGCPQCGRVGHMPQVLWSLPRAMKKNYLTAMKSLADEYGGQALQICPAAPQLQVLSDVRMGYGLNFTIVPYVNLRDESWETGGCKRNPAWAQHSPYRFSDISAPTRLILFADAEESYVLEPPVRGVRPPAFRHGGQVNAVFTDGSAKSLKQDDSGFMGFAYWNDQNLNRHKFPSPTPWE